MVKKGARGLTLQLPQAAATPAKAAAAGEKRKHQPGGGTGPKAERKAGDKGGGKGGGQRQGADGGSKRRRRSGGRGDADRGGRAAGEFEQPGSGEALNAREGPSRSAIRSKLQRQRKKEEAALPTQKRKRIERKRKLKDGKEVVKAGKSVDQPVQAQQPVNQKKKKMKASEVTDAMCKKGHTMIKRSDNPAGYMKPAACDKCGLANLSRKVQYYFHCSFCKWDICPDCILAWRLEGKRPPKHIREKMKEENAGVEGKLAIKAKNKADARLGKEIDEKEFNRQRREIWLPTDNEAVNRAPLSQVAISEWVEGVPL